MLLMVLCCKGPGKREVRSVDEPSQTKVNGRGGVEQGGVGAGQQVVRFLISSECRFSFLTVSRIIAGRNRTAFHPCDPPAHLCRAGVLAGPPVDVL